MDYMSEILKSRQAQFLNAYFDRDTHTPAPQGVERVEMHGIHREPKPGVIQARGNVRVPQAYIFDQAGRRVSTARSKRFSSR